MYYSDLWRLEDVRNAIIEALDDPNPEVSASAAYICGKAKYVDAVDGLIKLLKNNQADNTARSEAAIALGRMEWKPARRELIALLRQEFANHPDNTTFLTAIIYAFYEMRDPAVSHDVLQILTTCLDNRNCHEELYQYAFFYLKSLKIAEASELSFKYIDSDISTSIKCYAVDNLRFASKKTDVPHMKEVFEKTQSDTTCQVVYRKFHEEASIILFEEDPMRALLVRAIGNYMNPDDYDWIWMVGSNTSENPMTRKVAEIYTRAMIEKGITK